MLSEYKNSSILRGETPLIWSNFCIAHYVQSISQGMCSFPVSLPGSLGSSPLITSSSLNTSLADAKLVPISCVGESVYARRCLCLYLGPFSGRYMVAFMLFFCLVYEIMWIPPEVLLSETLRFPPVLYSACSATAKHLCTDIFFHMSSSQQDIIHHHQRLCTTTSQPHFSIQCVPFVSRL